MKTFKQFNESIKDKMTPKSKEDMEGVVSEILKKTPPGNEPLAKFFYGCQNGLLWLVEEGLSEGADINSNYGYMLVVAAQGGSVEVVEYLLNHGISVKYLDDAINVAAVTDKIDVVHFLKVYRSKKDS